MSAAIQLARTRARFALSRRCMATAAAHPAAASSSSATASEAVVPLSNVEAQWEKLSKDEQSIVHRQLEDIQKKDWKTLSIDEKKAGTFRFVSGNTVVSLPFPSNLSAKTYFVSSSLLVQHTTLPLALMVLAHPSRLPASH